MKHLFIINPAAGSRDRTAEYRENIDKICSSRGLCYRVAVSEGPGHVRTIAHEAAQSGEDYRIYACGGDGTLNEIVAGVAGFSNVSVTHYAGGSGNDFIKIFSDTTAFRNLEQLLDCREVQLDLIRCNDDYALNICSVGLDARIGTDVASYKRIPLLQGFRAYAMSALVNTIRGVNEHYKVEINGQTLDREFALICACNGRFYGGGFNPVPDADPCDGMMDVLLVDKVSRLKVLTVIGKYKNGHYRDYPQTIHHCRTESMKIICDKTTPINLDGELRMDHIVNIRLAEEKIRFFYPNSVTILQGNCVL